MSHGDRDANEADLRLRSSGELAAAALADEADEACLVSLYPPDVLLGRRFALHQIETVIGRASEADITLDVESASRKHCKIVVEGDAYVVVDLGSTNGTYVNGVLTKRQTLVNGDLVMVGGGVLRFLHGGDRLLSYFEEIRGIVDRDGLTQLYHPETLYELLERELARANRAGRPHTLILLDIDGLAELSETYGPQAADHLVMHMTRRVSALVGEDSILARHTHATFAISIPELSRVEARAFAERLRDVIAQQPFHFEGDDLRVTASAGVYTKATRAITREALVETAIIRLYVAHLLGGNQVVEAFDGVGTPASGAAVSAALESAPRLRMELTSCRSALALAPEAPGPRTGAPTDVRTQRAREDALAAAILLVRAEMTLVAGQLPSGAVLIASAEMEPPALDEVGLAIAKRYGELTGGGTLTRGSAIVVDNPGDAIDAAEGNLSQQRSRRALWQAMPQPIAAMAQALEEEQQVTRRAELLIGLHECFARWTGVLLTTALRSHRTTLVDYQDKLRALFQRRPTAGQWIESVYGWFTDISKLDGDLLGELGFDRRTIRDMLEVSRQIVGATSILVDGRGGDAYAEALVEEWQPTLESMIAGASLLRDVSPMIVETIDIIDPRAEFPRFRYGVRWLTGPEAAGPSGELETRIGLLRHRVYAWSHELADVLPLHPFVIVASKTPSAPRELVFFERALGKHLTYRNLHKNEELTDGQLPPLDWSGDLLRFLDDVAGTGLGDETAWPEDATEKGTSIDPSEWHRK